MQAKNLTICFCIKSLKYSYKTADFAFLMIRVELCRFLKCILEDF